jgi:Flp pilus assembly protein TadG
MPPSRAVRRVQDDDPQRGASAVEFALVVPIFIMLVFGIISFGMLFAQELGLSNGARQAARFGVVDGRTCGQLATEARNAAQTLGMTSAQVNVQVKRGSTAATAATICGSSAAKPCAGSVAGDSLFVTTSFNSRLMIPLVVTRDVTLTEKGIFRCEYS